MQKHLLLNNFTLLLELLNSENRFFYSNFDIYAYSETCQNLNEVRIVKNYFYNIVKADIFDSNEHTDIFDSCQITY